MGTIPSNVKTKFPMKKSKIVLITLVFSLGGFGIYAGYDYLMALAAESANEAIQEARTSAKNKAQAELLEQERIKLEQQKQREAIEAKLANVPPLFDHIADTYSLRPSTLEWGCKTPNGVCYPLSAPPQVHLSVHKAAWHNLGNDQKLLLRDYVRYHNLDGIMLVLPQNGKVLIEGNV